MSSIQYGNKKIRFKIERSNRRKTVGIYIDPKEGVLIRTPLFLKANDIDEIVRKRARWIIEKQELMKNIDQLYSFKEFVSGEGFPYLGRRYRLKVIRSASEKEGQCNLINGRFMVEIDRALNGKRYTRTVKKALITWYEKHAKEKLLERVKLYASQMGTWPERIEIKNHKRRWGSCSHDRIVRLNWKIIMAPMTILDYVIVHELCHLIHPHHSAQFWQKVQTIIPDYATRRDKLKEISFQIRIFD
jgi:predicted metal-dependent hydrolase